MDGVQSSGNGVAALYAMKKAMKVQEKQASDILGGMGSAQTQSSGVQEPSQLASQTTGKGQSLDLRA